MTLIDFHAPWGPSGMNETGVVGKIRWHHYTELALFPLKSLYPQREWCWRECHENNADLTKPLDKLCVLPEDTMWAFSLLLWICAIVHRPATGLNLWFLYHKDKTMISDQLNLSHCIWETPCYPGWSALEIIPEKVKVNWSFYIIEYKCLYLSVILLLVHWNVLKYLTFFS